MFTLVSVMSVDDRRRMKEIRKVGMLTDFISGPPARNEMTLRVNILLLRPSNALLAQHRALLAVNESTKEMEKGIPNQKSINCSIFSFPVIIIYPLCLFTDTTFCELHFCLNFTRRLMKMMR